LAASAIGGGFVYPMYTRNVCFVKARLTEEVELRPSTTDGWQQKTRTEADAAEFDSEQPIDL
jgi:hypothetical protein